MAYRAGGPLRGLEQRLGVSQRPTRLGPRYRGSTSSHRNSRWSRRRQGGPCRGSALSRGRHLWRQPPRKREELRGPGEAAADGRRGSSRGDRAGASGDTDGGHIHPRGGWAAVWGKIHCHLHVGVLRHHHVDPWWGRAGDGPRGLQGEHRGHQWGVLRRGRQGGDGAGERGAPGEVQRGCRGVDGGREQRGALRWGCVGVVGLLLVLARLLVGLVLGGSGSLGGGQRGHRGVRGRRRGGGEGGAHPRGRGLVRHQGGDPVQALGLHQLLLQVIQAALQITDVGLLLGQRGAGGTRAQGTGGPLSPRRGRPRG
eukprot:RCo011483